SKCTGSTGCTSWTRRCSPPTPASIRSTASWRSRRSPRSASSENGRPPVDPWRRSRVRTSMPYRDDYDAMANRCSELERELSRSRAELEQARRARSLPLLDQIRVASPCKASWDAMEGGDQVRFCVQCSKNVYDLSGMTREAAEQLVQETEGRVCVRFYRRADGTVLTSDCPVGARKLRFRRAAIAAVGAGILALGAAWATATTHHRP